MSKISEKIYRLFKEPPYFLFLLAVFLLPIQTRRVVFTSESFLSGNYIFYNTLFLYLTDLVIILLAIVMLGGLLSKTGKKQTFDVKHKRIIWVILLFFVISCISFAFSTKYYPIIEYFSLFKLFLLILFFISVTSIVSVKQSYKAIFWLILAISIFQGILGISQYFVQHSFGLAFLGEEYIMTHLPGIAKFQIPGAQKWVVEKFLDIGHGFSTVIRPYGTFPHPNVYGAFMFFSSLTTMYLLLVSRKKLLHAFFTTALFLQVFAGVISFSRVAIVAWVGSAILLLAILWAGVSREGRLGRLIQRLRFIRLEDLNKEASGGNVKRLGITLLIICAICGFLFYPQFLERGGVVSYGATNYESISDRSLYQQTALEMVGRNPLLGVGPQNFAMSMDAYAPAELESYQHQPVHNIYLLVAAETGLPAAILFILFFLMIVWSVLKKGIRLHSAVLLAALAGFLFIGLFDHYLLTIQQGRLMLFLTAGLLVASLASALSGDASVDSELDAG